MLTNKELYAYVLQHHLAAPPDHEVHTFDQNLMAASADTRKQIVFRCLQRAQSAGRPLDTVMRLTGDEVHAINDIFKARS